MLKESGPPGRLALEVRPANQARGALARRSQPTGQVQTSQPGLTGTYKTDLSHHGPRIPDRIYQVYGNYLKFAAPGGPCHRR